MLVSALSTSPVIHVLFYGRGCPWCLARQRESRRTIRGKNLLQNSGAAERERER